jgi:hypothetical protein
MIITTSRSTANARSAEVEAVWRSGHALFDDWRAIGRKTGVHFSDRAPGITGRFAVDGSRARKRDAATTIKRGWRMFQGQIDQDTATAVEASAIPDVLFERGLYWASGRSGVVNLVAAHKWFNLAALKGRADAIRLRREVAELMSEVEIATAQREARAWMTAH